ncbi:hypothetical protein M8494_25485 [Serratia ureilytica]
MIEGPTLQPSGTNGVRYLMIAGPDGGWNSASRCNVSSPHSTRPDGCDKPSGTHSIFCQHTSLYAIAMRLIGHRPHSLKRPYQLLGKYPDRNGNTANNCAYPCVSQ